MVHTPPGTQPPAGVALPSGALPALLSVPKASGSSPNQISPDNPLAARAKFSWAKDVDDAAKETDAADAAQTTDITQAPGMMDEDGWQEQKRSKHFGPGCATYDNLDVVIKQIGNIDLTNYDQVATAANRWAFMSKSQDWKSIPNADKERVEAVLHSSFENDWFKSYRDVLRQIIWAGTESHLWRTLMKVVQKPQPTGDNTRVFVGSDARMQVMLLRAHRTLKWCYDRNFNTVLQSAVLGFPVITKGIHHSFLKDIQDRIRCLPPPRTPAPNHSKATSNSKGSKPSYPSRAAKRKDRDDERAQVPMDPPPWVPRDPVGAPGEFPSRAPRFPVAGLRGPAATQKSHLPRPYIAVPDVVRSDATSTSPGPSLTHAAPQARTPPSKLPSSSERAPLRTPSCSRTGSHASVQDPGIDQSALAPASSAETFSVENKITSDLEAGSEVHRISIGIQRTSQAAKDVVTLTLTLDRQNAFEAMGIGPTIKRPKTSNVCMEETLSPVPSSTTDTHEYAWDAWSLHLPKTQELPVGLCDSLDLSKLNEYRGRVLKVAAAVKVNQQADDYEKSFGPTAVIRHRQLGALCHMRTEAVDMIAHAVAACTTLMEDLMSKDRTQAKRMEA